MNIKDTIITTWASTTKGVKIAVGVVALALAINAANQLTPEPVPVKPAAAVVASAPAVVPSKSLMADSLTINDKLKAWIKSNPHDMAYYGEACWANAQIVKNDFSQIDDRRDKMAYSCVWMFEELQKIFRSEVANVPNVSNDDKATCFTENGAITDNDMEGFIKRGMNGKNNGTPLDVVSFYVSGSTSASCSDEVIDHMAAAVTKAQS